MIRTILALCLCISIHGICQPVPVGWKKTGASSRDYLQLMERIVRAAAPWVDSTGAVLDPYYKAEYGQTTPRFVSSAAILLKFGYIKDLKEKVFRAMTYSCSRLSGGMAESPDFWMRELTTAYYCLQPIADTQLVLRWQGLLRRVDPENVYKVVSKSGEGMENLHNWAVYSSGGEYVRQALGLTDPNNHWLQGQAFFDKYMGPQLSHFTAEGMYRDPNDPITYDITTRLQIANALSFGYDGPLRERLDEILRKGGLTMLHFTSPDGLAPFGGRSSQFNFQEGIIAALCELEAKRYKTTDIQLAGAFRRQAHLSAQSIRRWVMDMQPLRHIKNGFPPGSLHGIDEYGKYSVYSLYCSSVLGLAALYADDSIEEAPCPSETGGYVLELSPAFHKVFASTASSQIEIDTEADPHYDATGLGRFQVKGVPVELGLGMPFSAHPNYRMADSLRPREPVAIGPGWKSGSVWRSLAADSGYSHHTTIDRLSPDTIGLSVEYKRGGFGVSQRYTLTGDELAILSSVDAAVDSTCFVVPLLVSDGTTKSNCHVSEGDIGVRYLGYNYSVLFDKRMSYEISPAVFANRNGIYKNLIIRSKGNRIDVRLKLHQEPPAWIRINQLGYAPDGLKTAVLAAKDAIGAKEFEVIDANSHQTVYKAALGRSFGSYGPFADTRRLDFPAVRRPGRYFIRAGTVVSAEFLIGPGVYDGAADFCLRYLRQQRSGFNPFLKDSCHTHDGYTLYAPVKDSTHIDVVGGWHDASDYLQYSTTTANAVFHLLAAWRDFPGAFGDQKQANGLDGANKIPDVLDEAKWGLDWLLKMHPKPDWLFNQLGDDRDHRGMRIPKEDTNYYGRGLERPVYFCTGQPQVRGRFMNQTTGVASTAGKFAAAFALGNKELAAVDSAYARRLGEKARTALQLGLDKPGVCQTASVLSPYIYAEDNWTDDMELAAAALNQPDKAWDYARQEKITPWLGGDTARHYQWYPFINVGHYELAKIMKGVRRDSILAWYREGIDRVWQKAKTNAFYRHIPFIWCSNNLTVSFAIQCYWYRQLSGDRTYRPMEQACFDWIFGCNPWGTSMVYGLPSDGDTPSDPHSAFTHLKNYPIDGGLVDGPVYTSIYDHLIGIRLTHEDAYKEFQSGLAVYHDDYGDYSTNEPTMDGTASLVYLLAAQQAQADKRTVSHGAIVRGDSSRKNVALVFTADEFGEGLTTIAKALGKQKVKGSFFFTGRLYRNPAVKRVIRQLHDQGNYLGPHSDQHLLYADWTKRDSTLVSADSFRTDLQKSLSAMHTLGPDAPHYFIPPYEWWNDTVAAWSRSMGWQLVNFTPGIRTNADYTYPEMGRAYLPSDAIIKSVQQYEATRKGGLNGAIILIHAGTDPRRKDKLYDRLDETIRWLKKKGYHCVTIPDLLAP